MPVKRIGGPTQERYPEILKRLVEELGKSEVADIQRSEAPLIIEEPDRRGKYLHVTVIWDQWFDVPKQERSRLIVDAYEAKFGEEKMLSIRFALGLTWKESESLGLLESLNLHA